MVAAVPWIGGAGWVDWRCLCGLDDVIGDVDAILLEEVVEDGEEVVGVSVGDDGGVAHLVQDGFAGGVEEEAERCAFGVASSAWRWKVDEDGVRVYGEVGAPRRVLVVASSKGWCEEGDVRVRAVGGGEDPD